MKKNKVSVQNLALIMDKVDERIIKLITPKKFAFFLTIIYVVSLIPLLWIGRYNYPSADDYTNGSQGYQTWKVEYSVLRVLGEAFSRMVDEWFEWRGCFTSSFLSALTPNVWGERWYVLTIWISLGAITISTIYLMQVLVIKVLKADKYLGYSVAIMMLFIMIHNMPENGRVEAFYWYSGAINYTFLYAVSLLYFGALIQLADTAPKKRIKYLIWSSFLGFFVGGGNQMTALNTAIVVVTVAGGITVRKKWKNYRCVALPILFFLIGFVLNIVAPGNSMRANSANGMNPMKAVLVSFYYCLDYCLGDWFSWPILILMITLIPLFWKMMEKTTFVFPYPLMVIAFGYCMISAMMTPPLFAMGNIEAARLQALTFIVYVLVLGLCEGYVVGYVRKKWQSAITDKEKKCLKKGEKSQNDEMPQNGFATSEAWCLVGCILFFAVASVLTVIPEPEYFTMSSAISDLANGSAKAYGNAMAERTELYSSGELNVVVQPLPAKPALIYFSDIDEDPEYWENRGLCKYYGIESVRVESEHKLDASQKQ